MTRKHYKLIAESFARTKPLPDNAEAYKQWAADITNLAGCLAMDNPRFDRRLFTKACGLLAS